jgi:hypothetical protein
MGSPYQITNLITTLFVLLHDFFIYIISVILHAGTQKNTGRVILARVILDRVILVRVVSVRFVIVYV